MEEAIEAYSNAIKHKPNFAEAYSNLGNVLKSQNRSRKQYSLTR